MSEEIKTLQAALKDAQDSIIQYEKGFSVSEDLEAKQAKLIEEYNRQYVRKRGDIQQSIKSVECRRFIWRILEICGPFQPSFDHASPRMTDFNEGKRAIGIEIIKMLHDADSAVYSQMANEHNSDLKTDLERRKKETEEKK
jgi:hypothetical protein